MKPPEPGDRVRFSAENEVVEGTVVNYGFAGVHVRTDDGHYWVVGGGDVLVVEDPGDHDLCLG